ncbi:MAG: hypothetical protein BROFUL_03258 [Candidatus Brocadia fulgida]|uniref:Uncharacterized protein n=1 Tax=Candidatus Brocadia fulgida TaxID=380242 RepID=A0A0M2UU99_9BACT|nr:MAG: hypothetical protein BROFUL_03258 [Candidatus Brocadia fulgida]
MHTAPSLKTEKYQKSIESQDMVLDMVMDKNGKRR